MNLHKESVTILRRNELLVKKNHTAADQTGTVGKGEGKGKGAGTGEGGMGRGHERL